MKTTNTVAHTFKDGCSLHLHGESLSVVDSEAQNTVTIHGLSRVRVAKEISWWLGIHACSHIEGERDQMLKALQRIQESLTEAINKLSPETEETAQ